MPPVAYYEECMKMLQHKIAQYTGNYPNYKYLSDFDKKNAFDIQKYQKSRKPKLNPEEKVQVFTINMENLQLPTERPEP